MPPIGSPSASSPRPEKNKVELLAADGALLAALAKGDARLLDDDLTWVDASGRVYDKTQAAEQRPAPLLDGGEVDVHRYGPLATVRAESGKHHVLRIWVEREAGWKLIVWHEVSQEGPHAPHGPGRKEHDNPCFTLPYAPRDEHERECLSAWQQLERAVMRHDPDEWARHVANEFIVVGAARRHGKSVRYKVIEEQRRADANSAPAPLVSARLDRFRDAMLMRCEHQPFHGKAARVSRVFVRRDRLWQMAVSFQTTRQDAPVVTI
jgi:hypothetical protein